jgi:hypothetical protein
MSTPTTEEQHIIPLDGKVNIEVSGYFYRQVMAAYFNVTNLIGADKTEELCKALADSTVQSLPEEDKLHASTIHTFLALCKTIENEFKASKLIIKEDIDIPPTEDLKS